MVQVLGSIEDEQCFNFLTFCKYKLLNQFTINLDLMIKNVSQKFYTLHNFLYVTTYDEWQVECLQHGVGT